MTTPKSITLDDRAVAFEDGETIYKVASRVHAEIPTLCYDERVGPMSDQLAPDDAHENIRCVAEAGNDTDGHAGHVLWNGRFLEQGEIDTT